MDPLKLAAKAHKDYAGNAQAAARALGISRATLWDQWERAKRKGLIKEPKPKPAPVDTKLHAKIEELEAALEVARRPRAKHKANRIEKRRKGDYTRVILQDVHGCRAKMDVLAAVYADLKELKPSEIVLNGDIIDCDGFLAEHHTPGYVAQADYSFEEDVAATNQFLDTIQEIAPQATIYYIEGNHEHRVEAWLVTKTLRHRSDAAFLKRFFSIKVVLGLDKRGIRYFPQNEHFNGLNIPGTIKLGKCHFIHGYASCKHTASKLVDDFAGNVVFGHTHRNDSSTRRTVETGAVSAWNPGCLCIQQPMWCHTRPTHWTHGYGVQMCRSNGEFLHLSVPVIDGRSFLVPLLR